MSVREGKDEFCNEEIGEQDVRLIHRSQNGWLAREVMQLLPVITIETSLRPVRGQEEKAKERKE